MSSTKRLLLLVCAALAAPLSAAADGRVAGTVLDDLNAMTLPTAIVEVVGTDTIVYTDMDGAYVLPLPAGTYDLKFSFSGYRESLVNGVRVEDGQTSKVDVALTLEQIAFQEQVEVVAEASPAQASQVAQLLERKRSAAVTEAIARDEMKKNADSDAAAAMQRVTGISVVDDQYVFVRGLGERYSNTTLNGSILPTTEPDKKVVPLDLFPTSLVDSVKVTKSYLPDRPAEFAGGLVEIEPINFPTEETKSFSFSLGWNSRTTFEDWNAYPGGSTDWLSYDDGTRALPGEIPGADKVVPGGIFGGGFTPDELTGFGRSFANTWEPRGATGPLDGGLSLLYGNSWDKFGLIASVTYGSKNRYQEEVQNYYKVGATGIEPQNDYVLTASTKKRNLGGVVNLAYRFSGNHRLAFENFYSNNAKDETRVFEGFNNDIRTDIRNGRLYWIQEGIFSSNLSGDHFFPGLSNSHVSWSGTYSRATRDEPDLRETLYEFNTTIDTYVLADESQSGFRMFNDLTDEVYDGKLDWSFLINQWGGLPTTVKFGPALTHRTRDFSSRRFRFVPQDTRGLDLSQSPEALFASENIGRYFQLNEETRATDTYDGEQTIMAGYAMVDLPLNEKLRFIGGARVENSDQNVTTFDLFNPSAAPIVSALENTDVLPGVNLVYAFRPDMNLRVAYSHTVNRPEFRELAPFEFTDVVGGRAVVGNPDLRRALIKNADLRWEWFPADGAADAEVVAVSVFWKDFTDPIERVVQATAQLRTSYANALGATNMGFEVEVRKALALRWLAGVNYTFVDSEIELEQGQSQVQTSLVRPLAGQSQNVLNGMLEYRDDSGLSGRVLVNWFDDRISDVGALGLPDIVENGRVGLDASLQKALDNGMSLRLNGENLLDSEVEYTQGGELQRSYKTGRSISLSFSYSR